MIKYFEETKEFHLYNDELSYIMNVLPNGHLGQIYYGSKVEVKSGYSEYMEYAPRLMTSYVFEDDWYFTLNQARQEYPTFGASDYRSSAFEIKQPNGSSISDFVYQGHEILTGKPSITGLPATYFNDDSEGKALRIDLYDEVTDIKMELYYTIYSDHNVISRWVKFVNMGTETHYLNKAMSMNVDFPDSEYDLLHFSGHWARERHLKERRLEQGIQSFGSMRGISSSDHNPFFILKDFNTDEENGNAYGFSLVYSGNFQAQVEVDTHDTTRVSLGINPDGFRWQLKPEDEFSTPEALLSFSNSGLNKLSHTIHDLYNNNLVRGPWKNKERPILLNNWEATYLEYTEEDLIDIAKTGKEIGVELFVLDDGWFGARDNDEAGLGDWFANLDKIPSGIDGLSKKINDLDMQFGIWIEPEMVNKDSNLYREHPDWILETPNRLSAQGRHQYVLDYSNDDVVEHIFNQLYETFNNANISYIKWDMNRSLSEVYSNHFPAEQQGEIYHRYILGVYKLYEKMIEAFPDVLFESCSSGGSRFDPGMLHYAPQAWTSDNNDAMERVKIQYGTSYGYPVSSMGAHVSKTVNDQLYRYIPIETRANVAYFGTFGYELDLNELSKEEIELSKKHIKFMKEYRKVLQFGTFYRLQSPFDYNTSSWMVTDDETVILGVYREINEVNAPFRRVRLTGLDPDSQYYCKTNDKTYSGSELMNLGIITTDGTSGYQRADYYEASHDFNSKLFVLKKINE